MLLVCMATVTNYEPPLLLKLKLETQLSFFFSEIFASTKHNIIIEVNEGKSNIIAQNIKLGSNTARRSFFLVSASPCRQQ